MVFLASPGAVGIFFNPVRPVQKSSMFRRILVCNRGEIAARIIRGVQKVGAEAVVAAADDDASSIAALTADRVTKLGLKGPQAFLDAERLVRAAVDNGCDALHPGIGFLSESPVVCNLLIACLHSSTHACIISERL